MQPHRVLRTVKRQYDVYNRAEISRSALLYNADFFRKKSGLDVIPVLKGNAYGHGIEQVATALMSDRLTYVAVDGYFEALKVRAFNKKQPVLVMGMIKPSNFSKIRLHGLTFAVQDEATIRALGKLNKTVKIHLEINTGMNRYGIAPRQLSHFIRLIKRYPKLKLEGVMTHLAEPDSPTDRTISAAVEEFDKAVDHILESGLKPTLFHTAQSGGGHRATSRFANTMRLGIGLYGINPYPANHPQYKDMQLRPALRLVSTISKVQHLTKGDKVSYSYTYTAKNHMRIGVLPLGYHEGIPRELSNKGVVKIDSKFQPIVGRVCMNHTLISLDGSPAESGAEVLVFSDRVLDENSIDSIARQHRLFPYSLLTNISPDVRRYLVA